MAGTLRGGLGKDVLLGGFRNYWAAKGEGEDTVDGDGSETLWGSPGSGRDNQADFLNGGNEADEIHAASGFYAGVGADKFVLSDSLPSDPAVRLTDFDRDEDALVMIYQAAEIAAARRGLRNVVLSRFGAAPLIA